MKRFLTVVIAAALAALIATPAFAAKGKTDRKRNQTRQCARSCQGQGEATAQMKGSQQGKGTVRRDRTRDCAASATSSFVDADGDGVCDNCDGTCQPKGEDADSDGVPNGQDPDYTPPQDGSGKQQRRGK